MAAVSPELSYAHIGAAAERDGLAIMGGLHEDGTSLLLLGPGVAFWDVFRAAPEYRDGAADPFDRWSHRVVSALADGLGAEAIFPFGGPPYAPFLSWALATGRAWSSPVGMLVHDSAGLMISFRGALRFDGVITLPAPPEAPPCATCPDQPCLSACPVGALNDSAIYDVTACHDWLDTPDGQDCMARGCLARRACPVSQTFGRHPDQSALHMKAFHKT